VKLWSWPTAALGAATLTVLSVAIPGSDPTAEPARDLHVSASLAADVSEGGEVLLSLDVEPGTAVEEVGVRVGDEDAVLLLAPVEQAEGVWTIPGRLYAESGCHEVGVEVILALGSAEAPGATAAGGKLKKAKKAKAKGAPPEPKPTKTRPQKAKAKGRTVAPPPAVGGQLTLSLSTQLCAPAPACEASVSEDMPL
jgi:hypothetical protein